MNSPTKVLAFTLAAAMTGAVGAGAGEGRDLTELAKTVQNPVADLISTHFQYDIGFNAGPHNRSQHTLNVQPFIPLHMSDDWNFIWRTTVPLVVWPDGPHDRSIAGLSDVDTTLLLSPKGAKKVPWGIGPILTFPTGTRSAFTSGKWGAGPSAAILTIRGPVVAGAQVNNVWSYVGWGDKCVNEMELRPFIDYNIPGGWYAFTAPIITADWRAPKDQRWTVPFGGGIGRVFQIEDQPINVSVQAYYNVEHPDHAAEYSVSIEFTLLFPGEN